MRRILSTLAVAGALVVAIVVAGRLSDGPLSAFPGGPLSGERVRGSEPDWSVLRDVDTIELQIDSSPPRSILTGVLFHEGRLYLPVTLAPLKRWQYVVERRPRVVIRMGEQIYERDAVAVTDPDALDELIAVGQAKYGPPFHARWAAPFTGYFRLDPPSAP
jgi:hypothetical protein